MRKLTSKEYVLKYFETKLTKQQLEILKQCRDPDVKIILCGGRRSGKKTMHKILKEYFEKYKG